MIGYNPSHLNKNETLLEAFHRIEAYLKANPQYQVYQSSATYQEGTQEYALATIIVPEGSKVSSGDVVLFSNVYYAVITAVSETTFSVETATNFRGAQGEQGPKGDTGATGAKGETGLPALMYSKNVILGPYQSFSTDLDGYNRPPQINDVCAYYSSNTDTIVSGTIEEIRPDTQQVFVRKIAILSTRGPQGPAGPEGQDGEDGNATLLYSGELSESITTVEAAQITRPKNRGILVKDILISTAASTFGAMAQVTEIPTFGTTVTVSFIGTLQGGSGVSDYNNLDNIPVINQDLSANGFAPVNGTYYRHTGTGGGIPAPVNPIAVGDTISKLYFDTTKEVDFSKFVYDQPFGDDIPTGVAILLSSQQNVRILTANDLSVAGVSGYVLMLMEKASQTSADVRQTILYASEAIQDLGISQAGWQNGTSFDLLQENTISIVNAQDVWGTYISKDGQWTSGGSAYTTGAIYYYNGTEYKAITGETKTPDYNQIENIPVINQDLSASGFTPVANTYYRHTGATTDTFTQGVIYLYDTAYHKLGESGGVGGTTLNRYELSLTVSQLNSKTKLLYDIYTQAKGRVTACQYRYTSINSYNYIEFSLKEISYTKSVDASAYIKFYQVTGENPNVRIKGYTASTQGNTYDYGVINKDKTITIAGNSTWTGTETIKIIYFNDTEII